ncbi:MAG: hypothetical protein OEW29_05910 [Acidimicrobiia bacterium]|nr:hypothetical protein [Acidimicrobiia bacterium]
MPASQGEEPHWHVMFAEADRDVTAEAAHRLGGEPDLVSEPVSGDGWGQAEAGGDQIM